MSAIFEHKEQEPIHHQDAPSNTVVFPSSAVKDEFKKPNSETVFRNYENSARQSRVEAFYAKQHACQTYDFVVSKETQFLQFDHAEMTMWDTLEALDKVVDQSDPDTELSQLQHALQSAEAARQRFPDLDWLHLVCLIHDAGKILTSFGEEQWACVGDSFVVGARFSEHNIFPQYFSSNPDQQRAEFSTDDGIYETHCGLDKLKLSWGHDEYLYRVLVNHRCSIPPEGLAMIRFHSFYPWHSKGAYRNLTTDEDESLRKWVLLFNEFDLYSKDAVAVDVEAVKPYYQALIAKYLGDRKVRW